RWSPSPGPWSGNCAGTAPKRSRTLHAAMTSSPIRTRPKRVPASPSRRGPDREGEAGTRSFSAPSALVAVADQSLLQLRDGEAPRVSGGGPRRQRYLLRVREYIEQDRAEI